MSWRRWWLLNDSWRAFLVLFMKIFERRLLGCLELWFLLSFCHYRVNWVIISELCFFLYWLNWFELVVLNVSGKLLMILLAIETRESLQRCRLFALCILPWRRRRSCNSWLLSLTVWLSCLSYWLLEVKWRNVLLLIGLFLRIDFLVRNWCCLFGRFHSLCSCFTTWFGCIWPL